MMTATIFAIHRRAFPEGERDLVAELADNLLSERSEPATLSLVAEKDEKLVGHVAFSPVYDGGSNCCLGYILAPLAVLPTYHNRSIGSTLVESGIARLAETGIDLFLVYGDPQYYGRFGFEQEAALSFVPPYELQYPFGWLALQRNGGRAGEQPVRLACVASLQHPQLW